MAYRGKVIIQNLYSAVAVLVLNGVFEGLDHHEHLRGFFPKHVIIYPKFALFAVFCPFLVRVVRKIWLLSPDLVRKKRILSLNIVRKHWLLGQN